MEIDEGERIGFDNTPALFIRIFGDVLDDKVKADNGTTHDIAGFFNLGDNFRVSDGNFFGGKTAVGNADFLGEVHGFSFGRNCFQ